MTGARSLSGVQCTRALAQEHADKAKGVLLDPPESDLRLLSNLPFLQLNNTAVFILMVSCNPRLCLLD